MTDPQKYYINNVQGTLSLLQAMRKSYERDTGKFAGAPAELLRLLTEDPYFAWLHTMSELIVDLDSLLTQELLPSGTVAAVRMEIDRLTQPGDSPFWSRYGPTLQAEPGVVMAHGRLRRAINALPETKESLHHRKEWVAPRVHAKRKSRS